MSSPSLQLARPRRTLPGFVVALMTLTPAVGIEAGENGRRLELTVRDSFLPRFPVLVRVELRTADGSLCREVWDAEVELVVTGEDVTVEPRTPSIRLRNGVGSVLLELDAATDITLHAELGDLGATRTLRLLESDHEVATGTLPAGVTQWSGVVHVPEDLLVPEAATLRILPGTLVLMGSVESGSDGADINIVGRLESLGTAERPVTLTAAGPDGVDTPEEGYEWGELHHDDSVEESIYRYTIITLAGNSPRGGHTNTGPAVRPDGSRVVFESCSITASAPILSSLSMTTQSASKRSGRSCSTPSRSDSSSRARLLSRIRTASRGRPRRSNSAQIAASSSASAATPASPQMSMFHW